MPTQTSQTSDDVSSKSFKTEELNQMFEKGEECDQAIFAEMKSNILLVSGKHYNRKMSSLHRRIFNDADLSKENKIRLTRNHIQKIQDISLNGLMSFCPDVVINPSNPKENRDIKSAQMHDAVWRWYEKSHKIRAKKQGWAKRYLDLGEVFVKVFWDPMKGKQLTQEPIIDELGQVVGMKPVPSGDLVFEEHLAFNVLRESAADSIDESEWLCIKKLFPTKDLLEKVGGKDSPLAKYIQPASEGNEDVVRVFDAVVGEYRDLKKHTLMREWYFRPCPDYPTGYYIFDTKLGKLYEGPLPEGVFPIKYAGYKQIETSGRCVSHIRTLRPYQVEVNRAASKIAEHQVTLGDDKLILQGNSKVTYGKDIPGVRTLHVAGPAPTVLEGRSGEQYAGYLDSIIKEMYEVSPYQEWQQEKAQQDPWAMLYTSAKDRLKFAIYAEKFEDFLIDLIETALRLVKLYAKDEMIIKNNTTGDIVNMDEFRSQEDLCYQIQVDRQSGDINSQMGKQLSLNHAMQYGGDKLTSEDYGLLLREMPFLNSEKIQKKLTSKYDSVMNKILALDQGKNVRVFKNEDHRYVADALIARTMEPDYQYLAPEIQANYDSIIQEHERVLAQNLQDIKRMEAEFIPMDGPLVTIYATKGADGKPLKLPLFAILDLAKKMQSQGFVQEEVNSLGTQGAADTYAMAGGGPPQPPPNMNGGPAYPPVMQGPQPPLG